MPLTKDEVDGHEVQRLWKQGKFSEAQVLLERMLCRKPGRRERQPEVEPICVPARPLSDLLDEQGKQPAPARTTDQALLSARYMPSCVPAIAERIRRNRAALGQTPVAVRVPGHGMSQREGARLGYYATELRDGTLGYSSRRPDDCVQAAIATLLQVPSPEVPDLRLDEQLAAGKDPEEIDRLAWRRLIRWASHRGLTIMVHPSPPTSERRWIGIVPDRGVFNDHCVVMTRGDVLFDPMAISQDRVRYDPADIDYGITLRKE